MHWHPSIIGLGPFFFFFFFPLALSLASRISGCCKTSKKEWMLWLKKKNTKTNKEAKRRKEQGARQAWGSHNLKPEHLGRLCSTHVDRSYWNQELRLGIWARGEWKMAVFKLSFMPAYRLSLEIRRESPWTAQRQISEILTSMFSVIWSLCAGVQFTQSLPAWQW